MEPERIALKSSLAGADPEAPGQPRLSSREIQRTAVDGCTHADGSSKLGESIFLQAVIGVKPKKPPTQLATFQENAILPMAW